MMGKVIQFPKCIDKTCCPEEPLFPLEDPPVEGYPNPVKTLVISDSVLAAPPEAFKWPSAGPVDARYEKALEEQKRAKAKP